MSPGNAANFALVVYTPPAGNEVNFELGVAVNLSPLVGFYLSGNIGKPGDADPWGVNGIYQMRMTKTGKRPIKMKFYTPTNPQTVPQEANRAKFAAAMAAWMALTLSEKQAYNIRAKRRRMFGWGLFVREYYQAN